METEIFENQNWRSERRYDSVAGDVGSTANSRDTRTAGQRDRDRILYSSAFRRLGGITQVASPTELHPVHNRLIHSLKVAQVGRSLANRLAANPENRDALDLIGGIDPDVVEAVSLAHDLGHPPFGHVAEKTLDELLAESAGHDGVPDGFNGNAQSFRILTRLSVRFSADRESDIAGLNLTRATLNGVLKYPWLRGNEGHRHRKWGSYDAERADFDWSRRRVYSVLNEKSIEAALMDWADDITYAVHDVEDFFRAGLIPLDRLTSDVREQERFGQWAARSRMDVPHDPDEIIRLLKSSIAMNPGVLAPFRGSRSDRAALRTLTSQLIDRFVSHSLRLTVSKNSVQLFIDPELELQVNVLKLLTWFYVIESPSLVSQRYGQRTLITSLFKTFMNAAGTRDDWAIFPDYYQEAIEYANHDARKIKRIVADLIASMSESQVIAVHQRLSGQSLGSAMDTYIQ